LDEKELNTYLETIGEAPFSKERPKRLKVQSVLLFQNDVVPIKAFKHYVEEHTDGLEDVSISKIFRALLHSSVPNEHFLETYNRLK